MLKKYDDIKILIVEDETLLLNLLKTRLLADGLTVFTATDGEEGLEVALKEKPDLILLDLIMPKLDGLGFLKKLRQDQWGQKAEVMILTNLNDVDKITEVITIGKVTDYLIKTNWELDEIVAKIKNKLKI